MMIDACVLRWYLVNTLFLTFIMYGFICEDNDNVDINALEQI